ncbi:MAG: DUF1801 domain-containing protein [Lewinellaceae bacterium]|nr:DUF1801 domain-containing protein [Phaeodactylibacter sp.]MCB0615648.1 DUF1801 domain-containing protein [Phaeodactylibacter sp.]MCB9350908.1 DUF1801 domain-containing protein [Lewinellaceae bacterium]
MNDIEAYLSDLDSPQQEMIDYLHQLITSYPEVTAKIRYKIPFYYRRSWICYLNPTKDKGVELAFTRGNELSNEQGLLDARGRKQVSGVVFYQLKDIPEAVLYEVLQEAFLLDEEAPYSVRRKR